MKNKKIGILNKGKNNKFIDNEFVGFDVGIQDEGEGTHAQKNRFHDGKNMEPKANLLEQWWMKYLIFPLVIFIIGTFIVYKLNWN